MGRACQQACRFGAISMGRDKSYIDHQSVRSVDSVPRHVRTMPLQI
ncbi:MAG: hypothetical protein ACLTDF_03160 [Coprococcus sp.]